MLFIREVQGRVFFPARPLWRIFFSWARWGPQARRMREQRHWQRILEWGREWAREALTQPKKKINN